MQSGEFDFYGTALMALSGGPETHIAAVGAALEQRGIRYTTDRGTATEMRLFISPKNFGRLDDAFWDDVHGPREPVPDPYSFRQMVQEMHSSARTGLRTARRGANTVARRAAPRIARRYGGRR